MEEMEFWIRAFPRDKKLRCLSCGAPITTGNMVNVSTQGNQLPHYYCVECSKTKAKEPVGNRIYL